MSCTIFSAFSASLALRFSSSILTSFTGSPAPKNHLGVPDFRDSDMGLAGGGGASKITRNQRNTSFKDEFNKQSLDGGCERWSSRGTERPGILQVELHDKTIHQHAKSNLPFRTSLSRQTKKLSSSQYNTAAAMTSNKLREEKAKQSEESFRKVMCVVWFALSRH
ncbi:hypothetical protein RJ640_008137 [Escallonia rubra]|uniref:Uncharacterized protein n=1 Tax=Escallonia rubra TaxID=112253 RepID=A0AA88UL16_9ASTE|nr:hypothetical protein RJ640_008137 [Escallonia rubra]